MNQMNNVHDTYSCKICEFTSRTLGGLQSHISHTHKLSSKEYYGKYLKRGVEGICPVCDNSTKYVNMRVGYLKHCSQRCVRNDPKVQEKQAETKLRLYGSATYNNQEKIRKTCQERYGAPNVLACKEIREKSKKTWLNKYGVDNPSKAPEVIKKISESNLKNHEVPWVMQNPEIFKKMSAWWEDNFGNSNPFKTSHFKEVAKDTKLEKYGDVNFNNRQQASDTMLELYGVTNNSKSPTFHKTATKQYEYNGEMFDSSWELAVWIFFTDNNLPIIREPVRIPYIAGSKERVYFPDFLVGDTLLEIKGDYFFTPDGVFKDANKFKCMVDNNVVIWKHSEVKPFLNYCKRKFDSKDWAKQFRRRRGNEKTNS
jgi:hypothetical protein